MGLFGEIFRAETFEQKGAVQTAMRVLGYYCAIIRREVVFTVTESEPPDTGPQAVAKTRRLTSGTGHPACGKFPNGLNHCIEDASVRTGCPLVDRREIEPFLGSEY